MTDDPRKQQQERLIISLPELVKRERVPEAKRNVSQLCALADELCRDWLRNGKPECWDQLFTTLRAHALGGKHEDAANLLKFARTVLPRYANYDSRLTDEVNEWEAALEQPKPRLSTANEDFFKRPKRVQYDPDDQLRLDQFNGLRNATDGFLRNLGYTNGVNAHAFSAELLLPRDLPKQIRPEAFHELSLGTNRKLASLRFRVQALRGGKFKGRKMEWVEITAAWYADPDATCPEDATKERVVYFTCTDIIPILDLSFSIPQLKTRWSMFRGFIDHRGDPTTPIHELSEEKFDAITYSFTRFLKYLTEAIQTLSAMKEPPKQEFNEDALFSELGIGSRSREG